MGARANSGPRDWMSCLSARIVKEMNDVIVVPHRITHTTMIAVRLANINKVYTIKREAYN